MGIKFLCSQCGKKLNVKSFLAGKRGICPHCGAGVDIPGEKAAQPAMAGVSAPVGLGADKSAPASSGMPISGMPAITPIQAGPMPVAASPAAAPIQPISSQVPVVPKSIGGTAAPLPMGAPAIPVSAPSGPTAVRPGPVPSGPMAIPSGPAIAVPAGPAITASPPAPSGGHPPLPSDPIAEAPNAVWYVRPPSGGQFGPAPGETMRKWIGEGRVTADSLVWREGWSDWKKASTIFPQLGAGADPLVVTSGAGGANSGRTPIAPRTTAGSNSTAIILIVALVVLIIPLVIALVYLITRGATK